jgi:hypothetical protein
MDTNVISQQPNINVGGGGGTKMYNRKDKRNAKYNFFNALFHFHKP